MSALRTQGRRGRARAGTCERPARERGGDGAPTLRPPRVGEPTLDALITDTWEALGAGESARCPACAGELVAGYGAHARPAIGRCGDCGTTLS